MFNPQWELKFLFRVNSLNEPQCMVCYRKLAVIRKYNIARHYSLCHFQYEKYIGEDRNKLLAELKETFRINECAGNADEANFQMKSYIKVKSAAELERDTGSQVIQKKIYRTCASCNTFHKTGDRCADESQTQSSATTMDNCMINTFEVTWSSDTEEDIKPTIEQLETTVPMMLPNTTDTLQPKVPSPTPATNTTATSLPGSPEIFKNVTPAANPIVEPAVRASPSTQSPAPAEVPRDNLDFEREKLKVSTKLEKRKLRLEERKLRLEERKFDMTLEWQDKMFELRKMEMESKEKIARLELELKYKNNNS